MGGTVVIAMVSTDLITQFTSIVKERFPVKTTMVQTLVTEILIPVMEVPIPVMEIATLVTVVRTLVTVVTPDQQLVPATPVQQLIPVITVAQQIPVTLQQTTILIENVNSFKAVFSSLSIS